MSVNANVPCAFTFSDVPYAYAYLQALAASSVTFPALTACVNSYE